MLIIIEGVDCSGKTTLINEMMRRAHNAFHIRRSDVPKSAEKTEVSRLKRSYKVIKEIYCRVIKPNQGHLVVERFYPSELVYSGIKRGYEAFEDKFYSCFEKELLESLGDDIVVIHVFQEAKIIKERLKFRGDDYVTEEEVGKLSMRYIDFLNWTQLNAYSIPGNNTGIESAINYINSLCNNDFDKNSIHKKI